MALKFLRETLDDLWNYCKRNFGNLKFHHENPTLFVTSQFDSGGSPSPVYLGYRVFSTVYLSLWLLASFFVLDTQLPDYGLSWRHKGFFFIYLTNWGLIIQVIDTIVQAILVMEAFCLKKKQATFYPTMTTSLKFSWCMEAINNGTSIFITVLYWSFIHQDPDLGNAFNIHKHLMNSVYIVLNLCITARPVHLIHITCMFILATIYVLFSVIYYLVDGRNPYNWERYVYPVLDWSRPGDVILILLLALPLQVVFYGFCFGISKARKFLHEKFTKTSVCVESLNNDDSH